MTADAQGPAGSSTSAIDEAPRNSATAHGSAVIVQNIIEAAKDAIDRLRWPLAIAALALLFTGINVTLSLMLYYRFGESATWETLSYTHQIKIDAQLGAAGVDMKKIGTLPPPPQ